MWAQSLQSCLTLYDPMEWGFQAPLSMGFSRQECWSGLPLPPPGDLPDPGLELGAPALEANSLQTKLPGKQYSISTSFLAPEERLCEVANCCALSSESTCK